MPISKNAPSYASAYLHTLLFANKAGSPKTQGNKRLIKYLHKLACHKTVIFIL
ncbi:protein of unknown function [Candidatus Nitrotoga arctica]|uniref:Uncharacterized protein n=1 Tax=Candidatus Nitrotoga arctica TaxID=453162 RepID=A0ABN8AR30_9PROT|nr:protein of unknown function [Candidatus Nitrotoga arctica]